MMKTKLTAAMVFLSAVLAHGEDAFKVTVTPSTGQKPRPAMVLVPGLASDGAVWQSVVEHYRDRYDCHALTMAGFAGAPAVEGSTLEKARIELAAYIQAQKLERPVIVGHSMGGVLALWLASEKPDLTGPLVVVDAVPFLPALSFPDATVDSARPHVDSMKAMLSGLSGENWRKFQLTSPVLKAMASGEKDQARIAEWGAASDPRRCRRPWGTSSVSTYARRWDA